MKYKWEVDFIEKFIVDVLPKKLNEIEKDGAEVFNVLAIGGGAAVIVSRRPADADVSRENRSLSPY